MSLPRRPVLDTRPVHLVGASGSDASRVAVREAAVAAARTGAVLHLVHAFEPRQRHEHAMARTAAPGDVSFAANPAGDAEILLAEEARHIADIRVTVALHPIGGEPCEALRTAARRTGAEVATIGSSRARPRRFGLAWRLLRSFPCDLRIVTVDGAPLVLPAATPTPVPAAAPWSGAPAR